MCERDGEYIRYMYIKYLINCKDIAGSAFYNCLATSFTQCLTPFPPPYCYASAALPLKPCYSRARMRFYLRVVRKRQQKTAKSPRSACCGTNSTYYMVYMVCLHTPYHTGGQGGTTTILYKM